MVEIEATKAAQAKDTRAEKAEDFVDLIRKYGIEVDVNMIRQKFGAERWPRLVAAGRSHHLARLDLVE